MRSHCWDRGSFASTQIRAASLKARSVFRSRPDGAAHITFFFCFPLLQFYKTSVSAGTCTIAAGMFFPFYKRDERPCNGLPVSTPRKVHLWSRRQRLAPETQYARRRSKCCSPHGYCYSRLGRKHRTHRIEVYRIGLSVPELGSVGWLLGIVFFLRN